MKYIPAIDGLRAVAILTVLTSHFISEKIPGGFGVTLFFFISGYLITMLLLAERAASGTIDVAAFYVRRVRRLAPALMTMVAIVTAIYWLKGSKISGAETSAALLYYINYYAILGGDMPLPFGPLWSLAIEEHYYLVYPVLLLFGLRNKRVLFFALAGACVAVLAWRIGLTLNGVSPWRTYVGTDTRIDSIIFGALLALAVDLYGTPPVRWIKTALAISAALILASFSIRSAFFRETLRYTIQGLALVPIFYLVLFDPRAVTARGLLKSTAAVWIGKISYSLYLWHFPIWMLTEGAPFRIPLAMVLSFTAAAASYYLVETPLRARTSPAERSNGQSTVSSSHSLPHRRVG